VFSAPGKITLRLPNDALYSIVSKQIEVSGLLYKEKNFNAIGTLTITDVSQNIVSLVTFDCGAKQRTGYWTSYIKGVDKINKETGTLDNRRDLLSIKIS
jgi:hypothetical protein